MERTVDQLMLIGGELVVGGGGEWIQSLNPATEDPIGRAPAGTREDVDRAVIAARIAQRDWAMTDMDARGSVLRAISTELAERAEEIAHLETLDTGNTIGKMRDDVLKAARQLEFYAGLGYELKGDSIPATATGLHVTIREPIGVVGRIVPFNHPIMFAATRIGAPLMAGNTIVIKPPEQASLSSGILSEICHRHAPPGVINIVTGYGNVVGDAIVRHPDVRRIALTGSAPTGLAIQRAAADVAIKDITLELGGKNPCIVFPDADEAEALASAVAGMNFAWQGQSCGSMSRLLVHESRYDFAVETVAAQVGKLIIGDPAHDTCDMGPVITAAHRDKILGYIQAGLEDGARLVTGGGVPQGPEFERGFWVEPTVFADVTPDMRIFSEEIFGPVMSIIKYHDEDDAIELANKVDYGLTASIWTRSLDTALRAARRVEAGYVWINGTSRHHRGVPFGGLKASGLGREESIEELFSYTELKSINVHL